MAGTGRTPKAETSRRTRAKPLRGEWKASPGIGWQHGPIPEPPNGLHLASLEAWGVWFRAWWAANWTPADLPGLEVVIGFHSEVRKALDDPFIEGEGPRGGTIYTRRPSPTTELRQFMDNYGITPKGQQDRRWTKPKAAPEVAPEVPEPATGGRYGHLKAV